MSVATPTLRPPADAAARSAAVPAGPFDRAAACAALLPQDDLYGPAGAPVYEAVAADDHAEAALVARLARRVRGPVVDLACGGGRLTLALAARGAEVLAVDDAPAMLEQLRARLDDVPAGLAARVRPLRADATVAPLPDGCELVVLGATSIALFDRPGRARLLARVADALHPEGRVLVSVRAARPERSEDRVELVAVPERGLLATFAERVDLDRDRREVLVLPALVDGAPATPVALRSTVGVLDAATLEGEASLAGLRVLDRHPLGAAGAAGDAVLLELGRAVA